LGLERDIYLSIVKFLDSSILWKVWANIFFFFFIFCFCFCSTLPLVKNLTNERNTFTLWFIDWKEVLFYVCYFIFFLLTHFFIICIYSGIEFIKPSDDVKIQRKTITFTKDGYNHSVFINKMINSGIMRMFIFSFIIFIFIYSILLAKCYAFAQIIMVALVCEISFFYCNDFISFINLMRNRHCIWIKTRGPQR
jgi:hypothetical protein